MIKMLFFLKRHPSLDVPAFRALYESRHARLGEKHVPNATRYVRRFLNPLPNVFTGEIEEPEHDVVTELWFEDQTEYETAMANLARPDVTAEIVADEETIFDRSKHRMFLVEECDSVIA